MIVFVASIIRNSLCIIYGFFDYFLQKPIFTENYFLIAAINLATRGPLYTFLVSLTTCCDFNKANFEVQNWLRGKLKCNHDKVSISYWLYRDLPKLLLIADYRFSVLHSILIHPHFIIVKVFMIVLNGARDIFSF